MSPRDMIGRIVETLFYSGLSVGLAVLTGVDLIQSLAIMVLIVAVDARREARRNLPPAGDSV